MSQFEFLFSLYGLLLGLGIAELASGFSRLYDKRKAQPIGWFAPGIAALLICDLLTFWLVAWRFRDWDVTYLLTLGAAVIGLAYYFATTQVFPRQGAAESADAHAMAHRRVVIGILLSVNVVIFGARSVYGVFAEHWSAHATRIFAINGGYYLLLAAILFAPNVRFAAFLAWAAAAYLVITVGVLP